MPRPLNPLRVAGPVLLAVVGSLGWSVTTAAQPAPVRTGVLQLDERRGAVILDTPAPPDRSVLATLFYRA